MRTTSPEAVETSILERSFETRSSPRRLKRTTTAAVASSPIPSMDAMAGVIVVVPYPHEVRLQNGTWHTLRATAETIVDRAPRRPKEEVSRVRISGRGVQLRRLHHAA